MTDAQGNEIGKLFVGGLPQATSNESLRVYFSHFGNVEEAVVMMDNKTGRSRGFGYVKYESDDAILLTLDSKPHILDGKEIDAKRCNINLKGKNKRSLKIFVGGIAPEHTAEIVKSYFDQFGQVTDVNLMLDQTKQRHRGFAFVGFADEGTVKRLINMHYVYIEGKQVEIKAMEPPNFTKRLQQQPSILSPNKPPECSMPIPNPPLWRQPQCPQHIPWGPSNQWSQNWSPTWCQWSQAQYDQNSWNSWNVNAPWYHPAPLWNQQPTWPSTPTMTPQQPVWNNTPWENHIAPTVTWNQVGMNRDTDPNVYEQKSSSPASSNSLSHQTASPTPDYCNWILNSKDLKMVSITEGESANSAPNCAGDICRNTNNHHSFYAYRR